MASCITSQWANASPQVRLDVTQTSSSATSATLTWTLYYVASVAASTSSNERTYTVKIGGSTVKTGTFNPNGKKGTITIASGTKSITKNHSSQNVAFSVSYEFRITWGGVYGGTKSASGSISVGVKTKYTVSYNANGGSGAPSNQTKWHGENLTLSSTKPTRTGYTFKGWSLTKGGSVYYSPGSTCGKNENLTIYAVWEIIKYTVSYNANGGSGAPSSQTKEYGKALTISSTKPTKNGYDFLGWSTSSTATSATWAAGGSYTTNASDTLYAVWKTAATYAITYNANGGSGAPSSQTKKHNVDIILSSTKPTKAGYKFKGWGLSSSTTTVSYQPGDTYATNTNLTIYAVWSSSYRSPRITNASVGRQLDSNGNPTTKASVSFGWATDNDVKSPITISVGSSTYNVTASGTSGTVNTIVGSDGTFDLNSSYNFAITVSDSSGSTTIVRTLDSTSYIMDFKQNGIAFGKVAELENVADFKYKIRSRDDIEFDNNYNINGYYPDGTLCDNVFQPVNPSGNTIVGWGHYDKNRGNTHIYGKEVKIGVIIDDNGTQSGLFKPYLTKGDSWSAEIYTSGFITSSKTKVYFLIPLSTIVVGNPTVTLSSSTLQLRQNATYIHGSSSTAGATPNSISAVYVKNVGLKVIAAFTDSSSDDLSKISNNSPVGILWQGTITLS